MSTRRNTNEPPADCRLAEVMRIGYINREQEHKREHKQEHKQEQIHRVIYEEQTHSVTIIAPPNESTHNGPRDYARSSEYSEYINKMATCIRSGLVLYSDPKDSQIPKENLYVLRSYPFTQVGAHPIALWWDSILKNTRRYGIERLSGGSFNETFLCTIPPPGKIPGEKIVFRVARDTGEDTEFETLQEIYLTGYACFHGIGPKLFASYYERSSQLDGTIKRTVSVSAAWDGDCDALFKDRGQELETNHERKAETFGQELVKLMINAENCGFLHGDIKPANMLYRFTRDSANNTNGLVLCMTDFDGTFCRILPEGDLKEKGCIVVANVCMFLGFVRCHHNNIWKSLRDAVANELVTWCPKLSNCIIAQTVGAISEEAENRFWHHFSIYISRHALCHNKTDIHEIMREDKEYSQGLYDKSLTKEQRRQIKATYVFNYALGCANTLRL